MIKVADFIADFISKLGVKHVFTVSGAGDLHILDSIHRHPDLEYICNHHEQASAMSAFAYSRATQNIGVCLVTTGPGATNAITGMIDCWVDSVPGLYISGQVQRKYLIGNLGIRQNGIQEINIIDLVKPVTKYAAMVDDPLKIRWYLEKAVFEAKNGRPGPTWLDIPMDIQSAHVDEATMEPFIPPPTNQSDLFKISENVLVEVLQLIKAAERPLLLVGHGVKAAGASALVQELFEQWAVPVCVGWNAIDLIPTDHPRYVGRFGTYGQRAANFCVQNCDLLVSIGSRLNITQTGYVYDEFARAAKKIYVDIDLHELEKHPKAPDISIHADAKAFIEALLHRMRTSKQIAQKAATKSWIKMNQEWKKKYPVNLPEYKNDPKHINSFTLVDILTRELDEGEIIVPTASGSGYTSFHQAANVKKGQTIFTSQGFAEMGFDIPGAIGAAVATGKPVWQTTGDGGVQMNIQELQTLVHYNLPVRIFILSNQGYLTIRHTQNGLFNGFYSGSSGNSGVSLPNFEKLVKAYGISFFKMKNAREAKRVINKMKNVTGPCVCEVIMDPNQLLVPKTSFKILPDGKLVSPPIEDLFPFLDRDEFHSNMMIPTIDF
jgi:acetolactate synthase I/II/III large subunit